MMADKLPFRTQAAQAAGDRGPEGAIPPFREGTQGGAPGGRSLGDSLPMQQPPSPFREGFRPSPANPPLPEPGGR